MKGGGAALTAKRRWRFFAIAVLFLILLSMLVPLVFLLGLYNGFHSYSFASDRSSSSSDSPSKEDNVKRIIDHFKPIQKDAVENYPNEATNVTGNANSDNDSQEHPKDTPVPPHSILQPPAAGNNNYPPTTEETRSVKGSERLCELRFGSYCLWHEEHRENMKDSMVKKLKDHLFVARAYYPSIAKLPRQNKLTQELKHCIQDLERVFSESTTDADLKPSIKRSSENIQVAITKSQKFHVECHNVARKLGQILDSAEDEADFHMKQSAFLYQLAVKTMPKSLHCLSMKLTVEYFNSSLHDMEISPSQKFSDPTLHHYVIFSNNIVASAVVINSTVTHARDSKKLVFHVLTDGQNYFGMKLWFYRNTYGEAAIQVLNIEHLDFDYQDKAGLLSMFLPMEFRISLQRVDNPSATSLETEYVSVFSRAHYLLAYIFPYLGKVVVLDDDVVIQRDLTTLWSLNMGGKVNGASLLCSVRLGQLSSYLGNNSFDENSCLWMSGLNVLDLAMWRELNITETYRKLEQQVTKLTRSVEAAMLSPSLLTFQDQIYALDDAWTLSGLGHDYNLNAQAIKNAAVLHYNGRMKPWLDLGIPKYKHYWKSNLNKDDRFLSQCNVIQ